MLCGTADRAPHVETRALSWPTRSGEEFNDGSYTAAGTDVTRRDSLQRGGRRLRQRREDARGGALGVVFVLLEEDQVTDAGARAGYAALVDYLRKQINDIIPTLYLGKQDITDEEIDALIDKAFDTIEDAIRSVQSAGENFWSWVDADDTIGYKLLRFSHDDLADNYWDINERFQKVAQNGVVVEDWRVTARFKVPGRTRTTTPTRAAPRTSGARPRRVPPPPACTRRAGCRPSSTATPGGICTSCGATPSGRSARPT